MVKIAVIGSCSIDLYLKIVSTKQANGLQPAKQ